MWIWCYVPEITNVNMMYVPETTNVNMMLCAWNNQCEYDVMCQKKPMWIWCYVPETTNVNMMLCAWNNQCICYYVPEKTNVNMMLCAWNHQCEYDVMCLKPPMWRRCYVPEDDANTLNNMLHTSNFIVK